MTRQVRNVDQIRNLLRQMDRSVDDARSRREGVPPPTAAPAQRPAPTPSQTSMPNATNAQPAQAPLPPASFQANRPIAKPASPTPSFPSNSPPLSAPHSNGNRPTSNGSGGPPRLKAKPKRSSPDPLQDFQQRQAS